MRLRHKPKEDDAPSLLDNDDIDAMPEDTFVLPANNISPRPASRRSILRYTAFVGLSIVATVVGTIISLNISTGARDGLTNLVQSQQVKSEQRNHERDVANQKVNDLAKATDAKLKAQSAAICALLIAVTKGGHDQGRNADPAVIIFARKIQCRIPPELLTAS